LAVDHLGICRWAARQGRWPGRYVAAVERRRRRHAEQGRSNRSSNEKSPHREPPPMSLFTEPPMLSGTRRGVKGAARGSRSTRRGWSSRCRASPRPVRKPEPASDSAARRVSANRLQKPRSATHRHASRNPVEV